jgi:hypothetical protein
MNLLAAYGLEKAYAEHAKTSPSLSSAAQIVNLKRKHFKPSTKGKPKYGGLSSLPLPPPEDLPDLQKMLVTFTNEQYAEAFRLEAGPMPKRKKEKKKSSSNTASASTVSTNLPPR